MITPEGNLNARYAADRLHLSGAGYEQLARWLREAGGPVASHLGG